MTIRLLNGPLQAAHGTADEVASTPAKEPAKKSVRLVKPSTVGDGPDTTAVEADASGRQSATNSILKWDPFSRNCISRDLFDTIGDKWAMLILLSIGEGPLRNGEIKDRVEGISPKMLTQRLSVLVEDGLVTRTSHHQIPPRVDYELTELGESVIGPVRGVYEWTVSHMNEVMEFRKQHPRAS